KRCLYVIMLNNIFLRRLYSCSRSYFTLFSTRCKTINPYYLTGFADGEGCFNLSIFKDSRMLTGWQVKPIFKISLHNKDRELLESIKRYLGVGKIYKHGKDSIEFRVSGLKNIRRVINHFEKYPLITKKVADYILFKQAVEQVQNKKHLTKEGLLKLVEIKASLNLGLSEKFKESFPDVIPVTKQLIESTEIKDINWLIGFTEAEGCFQVIVQEYNNKPTSISLRFTVSQHSKDRKLMESIVNYLDCGRSYSASKCNEVYFITSTFNEISEKIIPLFAKYPLLGCKQKDYLDWVKVAELIKSKDHLTETGLAKIKVIKSNMNSKREHI
uniref:hypothetical protein n=1 Tax=Aspergillus sclerotioniger TaxID=319627 RepID=UPI00211461E4